MYPYPNSICLNCTHSVVYCLPGGHYCFHTKYSDAASNLDEFVEIVDDLKKSNTTNLPQGMTSKREQRKLWREQAAKRGR